MVVISINGVRITRPKSMVVWAASEVSPSITSDTSKEVPPRSAVTTFGKPAARAMAAAAMTPAAGPDSAVRTGKRRAVAVDITPPFDCTTWKLPRNSACASVEMRPAGVRIVEEEGVAGGEPAIAPDLVDHRLDGERHGADEDRQALCPLDERRPARRMVDAVAGVARFGNDRVEGRAVERRVHLVGDLLEPALEDRQGDGVESGHDAVS